MAIDRERGSFVQDEYRYEIAEDLTVKAAKGEPRSISFDTNLNQAAAKALADEILAEQKHVSQSYSVVFQGVSVVGPSDFKGSPPTFLCNFPTWPVELTDLLRVVSVEADGENWTTTVLLKGAMK